MRCQSVAMVDNRHRAHAFSFLFVNNFPFKYHKRDTKSRIMYLDQLDKREEKSITYTTRHHQKPMRSGANDQGKSMAQANVKHNINTNLQSLVIIFYRILVVVVVTLRSCFVSHCLFSEFPSFWWVLVFFLCVFFVKISPALSWETKLRFHFLNSI